MSASRSWTWREAGPADYEDQARLFNACFRKHKTVDTFRWKYAENPHGPAVSVVAVDASARVVGGYSYVPRRFRRDGLRVLLMQASDAMVHESARRQGIFTGLDDVVCEEVGRRGVPWSYAYSGRLSYNGFLGNGWKDIGQAPVFRYRFQSERGLLRLGRLGPLLARAAPLLNRAWHRRDRRLLPLGQRVAALTAIERFDESFDELFEATVPAVGLVGERDSAWLNWRYVDTPSGRQNCWALRSPDGRGLLGYLVAEFVDGNAYLVDHQARDEAARTHLLEAFLAMAHGRGMAEATAMVFQHHPAAAVLQQLGFEAPRGKMPFRHVFPWIVRACREDSPADDLSMSRWHLADGDRDAEHMSS